MDRNSLRGGVGVWIPDLQLQNHVAGVPCRRNDGEHVGDRVDAGTDAVRTDRPLKLGHGVVDVEKEIVQIDRGIDPVDWQRDIRQVGDHRRAGLGRSHHQQRKFSCFATRVGHGEFEYLRAGEAGRRLDAGLAQAVELHLKVIVAADLPGQIFLDVVRVDHQVVQSEDDVVPTGQAVTAWGIHQVGR